VERPVGAEARIVDEPGHREAACGHLAGEHRAGAAHAEVEGDRGGAHTVVALQLARELLQAVGAAGHQDHVGAPLREGPGEGGSDPRAGAGDDGGLGREVDVCHAAL
jgi:hypothetical protein